MHSAAAWICWSYSKPSEIIRTHRRQTLEVYLNVSQFGCGVFGVEAAAQTYFFQLLAAEFSREQAAPLFGRCEHLARALPHPVPQRLGRAADLAGNGFDGRPLRQALILGLEDHTHAKLDNLRGKALVHSP